MLKEGEEFHVRKSFKQLKVCFQNSITSPRFYLLLNRDSSKSCKGLKTPSFNHPIITLHSSL